MLHCLKVFQVNMAADGPWSMMDKIGHILIAVQLMLPGGFSCLIFLFFGLCYNLLGLIAVCVKAMFDYIIFSSFMFWLVLLLPYIEVSVSMYFLVLTCVKIPIHLLCKSLLFQYLIHFLPFFFSFGIPCCFLLPTIIGGLCWMLGGLIYMVVSI